MPFIESGVELKEADYNQISTNEDETYLCYCDI